ncbi:laccase domain-containing protein, partial [Candidatus Uhrbacteria bacterium]|nr:laccase domain-containing protein [Candidatus Uhrbacteria bacterium]
GTSRNWNYAGATLEEMEKKNPFITSAIAEVITEHAIRRALVPKPALKAYVVKAEDLTTELLPGFFRGADADGVLLEHSGDAYFLASADCPTTVIYDSSQHKVLGLHCGRDALIDRGLIEGSAARQHNSVIDAGLLKICEAPRKLKVFIAAGIGPRAFDHPTTAFVLGPDGTMQVNPFAERNYRLIEYLRQRYDYRDGTMSNVVIDSSAGHIDLNALIRCRLKELGLLAENVVSDGHDTATDKYHDGTFMFHFNRRDKTKRNLVVVKLL